MTWKIYERIAEAPSQIRLELVVDELVPVLAWSLHEHCGTEVLFYIRRVVEEDMDPDGGRIRFYAVISNPEEDVYIPRQRVSEYDVEVVDPPPLEYGYAVVHTHPKGVQRFSSTDREHINVNHPISILVESGRVSDACISLGVGQLVVQARPEVSVARRMVSLRIALPGGRTIEAPAPENALIKYYASYLVRGPLAQGLERIEGCKRRRRGRG